MPKTFIQDGSNIREVSKAFVKDGDNIREITKAFVLDGSNVRLVYSAAAQVINWLIAGAASSSSPSAKEVVEFGVETGFTSGSSNPAAYSISNTDIPAISGTFATGLNSTGARDAIKSALNGDTDFTDDFESPIDIFDASVSTDWRCRIHSLPTRSVSSNFVTVGLPGLGSEIITIASDDTIEDVVDTIVAADWPNLVGLTVAKVGTDTVQVAFGEGLSSSSTSSNITGFSINNITGTGGTLTLSQTDNGNSSNTVQTSDTSGSIYSVALNVQNLDGSTLSGYNAVQYTAKTAGAYPDFTYTITANNGTNTTPHLSVTTEGADGDPATVVTVTIDGTANARTQASAASTDTVGADLANITGVSYDASTDMLTTPLNTTIAITNAGTLTITEQ